MSRKISIRGHFDKSVAEVFSDFVVSQTAKGYKIEKAQLLLDFFYSLST